MPYTETGGLPFAAGSQESYNAAKNAEATRGEKTRRYLRCLRHGAKADFEAAAATGLPIQSICSIRNSAMTLLLVKGTDERRTSEHGQACKVWSLTLAGDAVLRAWHEMGV